MSFIEMLQKSREGKTLDVGELKLEDGKPLQLRFRRMVAGDFMTEQNGPYGGIPQLAQEKAKEFQDGGAESVELSDKEQQQFYGWLRQLFIRSVFAVREFADGKELWLKIKWIDDTEESPDNLPPETVALNIRALEEMHPTVILEGGMDIIRSANNGGDMASFGAGFREA